MNKASELLRNHMEADMMHDAIRADVLSVLVAASGGETNLEETRKDFADHSKLLVDNISNDTAYTESETVSTEAGRRSRSRSRATLPLRRRSRRTRRARLRSSQGSSRTFANLRTA